MAKERNKKNGTDHKNIKTGFRIVKESPVATKISKDDIEKAVEKAIALTVK